MGDTIAAADHAPMPDREGAAAGGDPLFADTRLAAHADFLMHLAFLPATTVEIAETLSGRRDAALLLRELLAFGVFDGAPDATQPYVLRAALRRHWLDNARARFLPCKVQALAQLAAGMLMRDGLIGEALDLYARLADWDAAMGMLNLHGKPWLVRDGGHALLAWLQQVPPAHRAASPDCQYWLGQALPMTRPHDKLAAYALAAASYEAAGDMTGTARCLSATLFILCLPGLSQPPAIHPRLQRLHVLLRTHGAALSDEVKLNAYAALTRAMLFKDFSARDLRSWVLHLARLLATADDNEDTVIAATALMRFYFYFGLNERANHLIARINPIVATGALTPMTVVWWHIGCSQFYFSVAGRFALALKVLDAAQQSAVRIGCHFIVPYILIHKLFAYLCANDAVAAGVEWDALERLNPVYSPFERVLHQVASAWYALLRDKPDDALLSARAAHALARGLGMPPLQTIAEFALASTLIALGTLDEAARLIKALRRGDQLAIGDFLYPNIRLIDAELARKKGNEGGSLEHLRSAFLIAREARSLSRLFWLPNVMSDLCARALANGVEMDFVTSVISTCSLPPPAAHRPEAWPWPIRIYALGTFSIFKHGEEILFSGKAQRKPLELLKVLAALGGEQVDAGSVTRLLWPDAHDDAAAQRSFHSNLHRLRKLIDCDDAVILNERKVSLNPALCWVDVWEFERLIEAPAADAYRRGEPTATDALAQRVNRALALYRSDFLVLDEMQPWIVPMRDKLRKKFLRVITDAGDQLEQAGDSEAAIVLYQRGLEVDCLEEEFYQRLINCRRRRGEIAEAFSAFRRCREALSIILGVAPSEKTCALYRELVAST